MYIHIPFIFITLARCLNNEHEVNQEKPLKFDFEQMPCIDDNDSEEHMDNETLALEMKRLIDQESKHILPNQEEIEVINLGNNEEKKEVKIGTALLVEIKKEIIDLLYEFANIFAWSYQDMSGLNIEILEHHLPFKPECKLIQQKLQRMKPEMLLKIKEEVKKQFDAGFLEE